MNTTCPICAKNMTECVGREPEPSEEPTVPATEPVKEPEKKSNSGAVLAVLLMIVMVGVVGWYFLKNKMPNPKTKGDTIWMTMTTALTRMTRTMPTLNPMKKRRKRNPNELLHHREVPVL